MWQMYRVIFRLRSPLHIGWNRIGNVQRTRPYVVGRSLWGALTMRLTRNQASPQKPADAAAYQKMGAWVQQKLAYTYLYPATRTVSGDYSIAWHWDEQFASRFLGSYASTALTYPAQSASEGTLHEMEFISPATIDTGEPVYLVGYLFTQCDEAKRITMLHDAFSRLQFGGERSYGWGRVALQEFQPCTEMTHFSCVKCGDLNHARPRVHLSAGKRLLAHTTPDAIHAKGELEPLVGREWRATEKHRGFIGQYVHYNGIYFTPGTEVVTATTFEVGDYGTWKPVEQR